ncbi:hypothetical protein P3T23_009120 [Paraburkholderia sp. GAS448]|uniref:hypothetical protein n=1 Tax=Paraburkholderia sp. GAS448 TaxID=3035136 RepID=UPI003D1AF1FC
MTSSSNTHPARPQSALYYDAVRAAGEINLLFLDLVKEGLTREELATSIKRRPSLWQRFETWLDHLPTLPAK